VPYALVHHERERDQHHDERERQQRDTSQVSGDVGIVPDAFAESTTRDCSHCTSANTRRRPRRRRHRPCGRGSVQYLLTVVLPLRHRGRARRRRIGRQPLGTPLWIGGWPAPVRTLWHRALRIKDPREKPRATLGGIIAHLFRPGPSHPREAGISGSNRHTD